MSNTNAVSWTTIVVGSRLSPDHWFIRGIVGTLRHTPGVDGVTVGEVTTDTEDTDE